MKPLGQEVWLFIKAVFEIWQGYVFAGVVAFAVAIYEHAKQRSVPWTAFKWGLMSFLFVSFFGAWREQYHGAIEAQRKLQELTGPKFEVVHGTTTTALMVLSNERGGVISKSAIVFIPVVVINHGAPSIVRGISMKVTLRDGRIFDGIPYAFPKPETTIMGPDGPSTILSSAVLLRRGTINPIPTGGQADGYILYRFPPEIDPELSKPGTTILFEIEDVDQKKYPTTITMTGENAKTFYVSPSMMPDDRK
ncbi:MAG TPA: hypothetical protein VGR72_01030 [Candidatus Acidoferrales bacterium]|nr:hypothetical protein [Candidatus Acidoferrales bacterium]